MNHFLQIIEEVLAALLHIIEEILTKLVEKAVEKAFPKPNTRGFTANFGKEKAMLSSRNNGFAIGSKKSISRELSYRNMLVVGQTGAGKSANIFQPSIYRMAGVKGAGSLIIHDPSGSLYEASAGYLARTGYDVRILNFGDAKRSIGYNPIARANSLAQINRIAAMLVQNSLSSSSDKFWNLQAVNLIGLFIRFVKQTTLTQQTFSQVRSLLISFSSDVKALDHLMDKVADKSITNEYKSFQSFDEKLRVGIIATALSALQIFTDEQVAKVTAYDSLSLDLFRIKKVALFITNPVADQNYLAPLTSIFFEQLFGKLLKTPRLDHLDVFCLIDEAGILQIPGTTLVNTLTNIRKYRAGVALGVQDIGQLARFGRGLQQTILTNCYTQVYFTGQGLETARNLEETLGKVEFVDEDGRKMIRPLMTLDQIRTLPKNLVLLLAGHHPPILTKVTPFYQYKPFKIFASLPLHSAPTNPHQS